MIYDKAHMDSKVSIERVILNQLSFKEFLAATVNNIKVVGHWKPSREGFFKLVLIGPYFLTLRRQV